jgi:hypothetical protein
LSRRANIVSMKLLTRPTCRPRTEVKNFDQDIESQRYRKKPIKFKHEKLINMIPT